jgi:hypothetical protein
MHNLPSQTAIRRKKQPVAALAPNELNGKCHKLLQSDFWRRLDGSHAIEPCQPANHYGAVQPVNAKFSVGSLLAFTVLPELTVTELLVIEVGEHVIRPFEPSASALTV